jgi:hypothetical protein
MSRRRTSDDRRRPPAEELRARRRICPVDAMTPTEGEPMSEAEVTTDHDTIRRWAEKRGGRPAHVKGTGRHDAGLLRIDFEPEVEENLELISWEDFFAKFDAEKLGFLHQDETKDGSVSRFHKFVDRG